MHNDNEFKDYNDCIAYFFCELYYYSIAFVKNEKAKYLCLAKADCYNEYYSDRKADKNDYKYENCFAYQ